MRKALLVAPITAMFLLSGCATTGTGSPAALIEQVRQAAVAACGFLPTVETVAGIISAGNPIIITASGIANAICAAAAAVPPTLQARRKAAPPMVNGVVIHGRFVRK